MAAQRVQAVGMAWYHRTDYKRILEVMADSEKLPETFDKWQSAAERGETDLKRKGHIVVRAHIDPEKFVAWCGENGLDVDSHARNLWGAEVAKRHIADTQH